MRGFNRHLAGEGMGWAALIGSPSDLVLLFCITVSPINHHCARTRAKK
jgi:hypothetical protein